MSEEDIRKIALEFFKDKFSSLYEKQKELIKRIDKLESLQSLLMGKDIGMSDIWSRFNEILTKTDDLEKKMIKFAKGYKGVLQEQKDHINKQEQLEEQIAELQEEMKVFKGAVINYNHDYDRIRVVRDVLREHLKGHLRVYDIIDNDEPVDKEWRNHLTSQLEKLDSPTLPDPYYACGKLKTEKKEVHDPVDDEGFITGNIIPKEAEKEKKDCNECDLYGECDHQGAYLLKNGKWCYEDSGGEKESLIEGENVVSDSKYLSHEDDSKSLEYMPKELKELMNNGDVRRYLHNNFVDGFNKGVLYGKVLGSEKAYMAEVGVKKSIDGRKKGDPLADSKLPGPKSLNPSRKYNLRVLKAKIDRALNCENHDPFMPMCINLNCGICGDEKPKDTEPEKEVEYCIGALVDGIHDFWEVYDLETETGRLGFGEELMGVLTKKKRNEKLREIQRIIDNNGPLSNYARTCSLSLYAEIKRVILKK